MKQSKMVRTSREDRIFYTVSGTILFLLTVSVLYPLIYILSASFSSGAAVSTGKVFLWPVDLSIEGYKTVFSYADVWTGYGNTIFYTVVGTFLNVAVTLLAAYPLSRKTLPGRGPIMFIFSLTMLFNAGMIPNYLLMSHLGLLNTRWALLLPGMLSVYNMIITRTFLQNIPTDILEAAQIDGCNDFKYFFVILLPLSKTIIAVIAMYYAVAHWNAYFNAFMYLKDRNLYPLQIFLREILVLGDVDTSQIMDPELMQKLQGLKLLLRYALIVVATVPILMVYPFVQKYFIKGVMIGSVKG